TPPEKSYFRAMTEVFQKNQQPMVEQLIESLKGTKKGLIIAGPGEFSEKFVRLITLLAHKLHFPIVADAASQLRFGSHDKNNVLSYFEGYIRTDLFKKEYLPEIIIHFGRFPTSKGMEEYLANVNCQYYLISEFGDIFDPCGKVNHIEQINPIVFLEQVLNRLESEKIIATESEWYRKFKSVEKQTVDIKREIIDNSPFPFEGRIINEVINLMPDGSHLMISNSMPVRDLDYFSEPVDRKITVYNNRGASGIDGIISTALGIAAAKKKPVVLVTGDLAFYYDLNGLLASKKYKIPLVVVLINNNGGGIFEMLPISTYEDVFEEYFVTPLDLDFAGIVNAYSGKFCTMKNWINFRENFASALNMLELNVLEIKTNAGQSVELRRRFWAQVGKSV
ncbi:MAG: thiamine pyrophosphate-dependent enzyme, partial [Methanococcaceae archaeon]